MSTDAQNSPEERLTDTAVTTDDFDELAELRIAAMRESLERVGRFDPERARARLRQSFSPAEIQFIVHDNQRIGFYTFRRTEDCYILDHLYIHPRAQAAGIGSTVLRKLLAQADAAPFPIRLNALRDSAANRFYQRHGFKKISEDEWDIYYVRWPQARLILGVP